MVEIRYGKVCGNTLIIGEGALKPIQVEWVNGRGGVCLFLHLKLRKQKCLCESLRRIPDSHEQG